MADPPPPQVASPEQSLCLRCGLCCDGTIFDRAHLAPADDPGRLADGGFILLQTPATASFALPCHHQRGRACTIYQAWRPATCHTFRCRLLRRLTAGEVGLAEAQTIVERTTELADRVRAALQQRGGPPRGHLKALVRAWQGAQHEPGWRRRHADLLLDYLRLERGLDQEFRDQGFSIRPEPPLAGGAAEHTRDQRGGDDG